MPQPTSYTRQFSFVDYSTDYPSEPLPGVQVDGELDAVKTSIDGVLRSLPLIQRDDGALKNNIVTLDSLDPAVLFTLGGNFSVKGAWVTATKYIVGDVVSEAGTTYVCAIEHISGVFVTDMAADSWVVVFGEILAIVPDGSIVEAKLADGSVTNAKVGFTALSLTGTIKGQGGIAGGTAIAGTYPISGKLDAGNSLMSIARKTRDQGKVGTRIEGGTSGSVWEVCQASSSDDLSLSTSLSGLTLADFKNIGNTDWNYTLRVMGQVAPVGGAGVEIFYTGSVGVVHAYNRAASSWLPVSLRGLTTTIWAGGIQVLTASSTNVDFLEATLGGSNLVGYRGKPQNIQSGNYTLTLADNGKHVFSANTGAQTITIPANASVAFPIGTEIDVVNNGTTKITIAITTDTLKWVGNSITGNRAVAINSIIKLLKVSATVWMARYASPMYYESAPASFSLDTAGTLTTGFGVPATRVGIDIICTIADVGYSIGDRVPVYMDDQASQMRNAQAYIAGVNVGWIVAKNNFVLISKTTHIGVSITTSSWNMVVTAEIVS